MKLFYRKYGNGPPLFILHGLYGSSDNWVTVARSISHKFTVYLPDQRNHGQSPHSHLHDYDSMSHDLFELIEELKINKIILAGHSMGGKVAVNFAMKWPEKINSLIIIDISPFRPSDPENRFYNEHTHILETILSVDLSKIKSRSDAESELINKIGSDQTRSFVLKNLQRTADNTFRWKINAKSLYDNLEIIVTGLPASSLVSEPVTGFPVLFVKGESSDYLAKDELHAIRMLFPGAEMITVKNAGHWVHADRPDAIAEIFLSQLAD
jgi:esterase